MIQKRIEKSLKELLLIAVASLACSPGTMTTTVPTTDTAKDRPVKGSPTHKSEKNETASEYSTTWLEARLSEKRLYVHGDYPKEYDIGIGKPKHPTPRGEFSISAIVKDPSWCPTRQYAWISDATWQYLEEHKCLHAGDPNNPLRAYWITFSRGYGIHGTNNQETIGRAESHGCIRMRDADIKNLVSRVRKGTRLVIRE